ncbi:MAG TPA: hypothetical protein VL985_17695 [Stellaceae bacterium]|nr:hypothetical protein [Stellaceae bacterium]
MQETAVVAVIDEKPEAGAVSFIEFKVHRSPDDPDLVLGSWCYAHGARIIDQSKPGTSILTEFRFAVDCADQNGIAFVWVNDPEELFPPWERR